MRSGTCRGRASGKRECGTGGWAARIIGPRHQDGAQFHVGVDDARFGAARVPEQMAHYAVFGAVERILVGLRRGKAVLRCVVQLDGKVRIVPRIAVEHRLERHHDRQRRQHARDPSS